MKINLKDNLNNSSKDRQQQKCARGFVSADLKAYLDNELPPIRKWYVGRHVARCHECNEEVVWLQRLGKNMRQLEDARPRPELRARILATLPAMDISSPLPVFNGNSRRVGALRFAMGGAFCLLVITGALAALHAHTIAGNNSNQVVSSYKPTPQVVKGDGTKSPPAIAVNTGANSQNVVTVPEDPTSKRADELYALEMKREKELVARRLPDQWKQAIASVRANPEQDKHGAQAYIVVAMDVKSVDTAQKSLVGWAHSASGTARVLPAAENDRSRVSVLLTAAPAASASLLKQLKSVGEISALKCEGLVSNSQLRAFPAVPMQSTPTPDSSGAAKEKTQAQANTNKNVKPTLVTKPTNSQETPSNSLTFVVMLTPITSP